MITEEKIMKEIDSHFTDSMRDRAAKELTHNNVRIIKTRYWWNVHLYDKTVRISVHKKYLFEPIFNLLQNNHMWIVATRVVKDAWKVNKEYNV